MYITALKAFYFPTVHVLYYFNADIVIKAFDIIL